MNQSSKKIFDQIRKPLAPPSKVFKSARDYSRKNYLSVDDYYSEDSEDYEDNDYFSMKEGDLGGQG